MARVNGRNLSVVAEVLGTGSDGTEPSLALSVRRHGEFSADVSVVARLLFNCGEGSQRLCGESGVKLRSLDSLFLTRLDPLSVSGVPGIIFSLGSLGAPKLRLHGPTGLSAFLGAIRSFVRRKYPQIECVHVNAEGATDPPPAPQDGVMQRPDWNSREVLDDDYARIAAVMLDSGDGQVHHPCSFCASCDSADSSPNDTNAPASTLNQSRAVHGLKAGRENVDKDAEHDGFKKWLIQFYECKEPAKVPYVDVILNRYRGRYADLKAQLISKYGDIELSPAAAAKRGKPGSSSGSSSDSDSDSDYDKPAGRAYDLNAPLCREWLTSFYQMHHPDRLIHIDSLLKKFQGREETLKLMLMQKYGISESDQQKTKPQEFAPCSTPAQSSHKKPRLKEPPSSGDAVVASVEIPITTIVEEPRGEDSSQQAAKTQQCLQSVCYAIWFKHLPEPHPVVWIIDCQSTDQIPSLASHFSFRNAGCVHKPTLVVHFSPRFVRIDSRYSTWLEELSSNTSPENCPQHLVFDGNHLQSIEGGVFSLSFLASAMASIQRDGSTRTKTMDSPDTSSLSALSTFLDATKALEPYQRQRQIVLQGNTSSSSNKAHVAQSRLQFLVANHRQSRQSFVYEHTGWARSAPDTDDDGKEHATDTTAQKQVSPPISAECPLLIILGTGSAAPSKLRASSSIYIELDAGRNVPGNRVPAVLLDCGEGTFGQLWRQFGQGTSTRIANLQFIWISHHHADHQCGLVRILYEYCHYYADQGVEEKARRLVVVAPQSVLSYVAHWLPTLPRSNNLIAMVPCREFNDRSHSVRHELLSTPGFPISNVHSVSVRHCYDSYGLVLTSRSGKKLVYSGDTQPCDILVRAGTDASLLIHEATFDDDMEQDARSKRHSTVGQALDVARRMNAAHVILTHFSQRYPSLPPAGSTASTEAVDTSSATMAVHCAFDGFAFPLLTWL